MRSPRRSTASTRPRGSTGAGRGGPLRRLSSPRLSGWTGSTTAGCSSPSATCRRPKPRRATTPRGRCLPEPRDPSQNASEKPGAVQLPAFRTTIWKDQEGRPAAHVHVDGLTLSVADFVSGALSRKLRWYEHDRHGVVVLVLRKDQCWHRTCGKPILLAFRAETTSGDTLDLPSVQLLEGYESAYAQAQAALPDLANSPWPFRRVLASRCPYCRREVRYQHQGSASR